MCLPESGLLTTIVLVECYSPLLHLLLCEFACSLCQWLELLEVTLGLCTILGEVLSCPLDDGIFERLDIDCWARRALGSLSIGGKGVIDQFAEARPDVLHGTIVGGTGAPLCELTKVSIAELLGFIPDGRKVSSGVDDRVGHVHGSFNVGRSEAAEHLLAWRGTDGSVEEVLNVMTGEHWVVSRDGS